MRNCWIFIVFTHPMMLLRRYNENKLKHGGQCHTWNHPQFCVIVTFDNHHNEITGLSIIIDNDWSFEIKYLTSDSPLCEGWLCNVPKYHLQWCHVGQYYSISGHHSYIGLNQGARRTYIHSILHICWIVNIIGWCFYVLFLQIIIL